MIVLRRPATSVLPPSEFGGNLVVVADTLSGTKNGTNDTFFTTYDYRPGHITIYYQGQGLHSPQDIEETGTNEIRFKYIRPIINDNIRATYERDDDVVEGQQDIDLVFNSFSEVWQSVSSDYTSVPIDLQVYLNGVKQRDDDEYYTAYISGGKLTVNYGFETAANDWTNVVYNVPRVVGEIGTGNILLAGITPVSLDADRQVVSFGQTLPSIGYKIEVSLVTSDSTPSVYGYNVADKTTSSFTVYFSGDIDTSNYNLEWSIVD